MLILLPPSEGKAAPRRGAPCVPTLAGRSRRAREQVLSALVGSARATRRPPIATSASGRPRPTTYDATRGCASSPTAAAERIYTGVLYDALGLSDLDASAHRRALARVAVVSSLYGLVRPGERIAPYRLGGGVSLPGLGGVAAHWRGALDPVVREAAGSGLVVDLRSSTYAAFWRPAPTWRRGWSPCGCCTRSTGAVRS